MAVEYIDSPNAGFIKLGEGVGLETITPQQKRKIKRGDRGVFPITPTGAESYEGPDFKAQESFSTPASAIPNVFDRYRTLPGGARAGGFPGGSFENVISPGTGNQNDDANDDDEDLEEELRRQTLDIDPFGDYALDRDGNPIDTGPDLKPGQFGYKTLNKLNNALDNFFATAGATSVGATGGGGPSKGTSQFDAFINNINAPEKSTTDIPKVSFGRSPGDPREQAFQTMLAEKAAEVARQDQVNKDIIEMQQEQQTSQAQSDASDDPQSVQQQLDDIGIDSGVSNAPEAPSGFGAVEAAAPGFDFNLAKGGRVPSFMSIKK